MSNHMINCGPFHANFFPNSRGKQTDGGIIQFTSRQPSNQIHKKDSFIYLDSYGDRDQQERKDQYVLSYKGEILAVNESSIANFENLNPREQNEYKSSREKGRKPINFYSHELQVNFIDDFGSNPYLDDYTFSLQSIYSYSNPYKHYSQKVTALDNFDFQTLKTEQLYSSRTVFGRLFYCLPIENRIEFAQLIIQEYSTSDFSDIPIIEGLKFLHTYSKKITRLGLFLDETLKILREDFDEVLDPEIIGFGFEKTELFKDEEINVITGDLIVDQVELFQKTFEYENMVNETVLSVTSKEQVLIDSRFEKRKKLKKWPIRIDL